jgi:hypothetical protein
MKLVKMLMALGFAAVLAGGVVTIANAGPTPSTTVVLVCDKNTDAAVTFTLQPSFFDPTVVGGGFVDCGPDSVSGTKRTSLKVTTTANAGVILISSFTINGISSGGCGGGSVIPTKFDCPGDGTPGASLTVR